MNILQGFSKDDDLMEFICTKCNESLWIPKFIVEQLAEDNASNKQIDHTVPPKLFCQTCNGLMAPVSHTDINDDECEFTKE